MKSTIETMVHQYIIENSYPTDNEWCTLSNMSKTLKEFPNTLRPIVKDLASRGVISYYKDGDREYMQYNEPDMEWDRQDLESLIDLY